MGHNDVLLLLRRAIWEQKNNSECVRIAALQSGTWTILEGHLMKHVPEPFWNEEAECYDCNCHEEIEDVRW